MFSIVNKEIWYKLYEFPGKIYAFYEMFESECLAEELLYDVWSHCFYNQCYPTDIVMNEGKNVF